MSPILRLLSTGFPGNHVRVEEKSKSCEGIASLSPLSLSPSVILYVYIKACMLSLCSQLSVTLQGQDQRREGTPPCTRRSLCDPEEGGAFLWPSLLFRLPLASPWSSPMCFGSPPSLAPSSSWASQLRSDGGCIDAKWAVAIPPPPTPQEGVSGIKANSVYLCVCVSQSVKGESVRLRVVTVSAPKRRGCLECKWRIAGLPLRSVNVPRRVCVCVSVLWFHS